jgi:hypothetical protein
VADGIDAAVNHVKAPRGNATIDHPWGQPNREELPASRDPVLPSCQFGHLAVGWQRFTTHLVVKCCHPLIVDGKLMCLARGLCLKVRWWRRCC